MPDTPELDALFQSLDSLSRFPGTQGPELFAVDGVDRLLLAEAFDDLRPDPADRASDAGSVVVLDDAFGALTLGALSCAPGATDPARVVVHQDWITAERALDINAERFGLSDAYTRHPAERGLDAELLGRARVVLLRLPKSLDTLTEQVQAIARYAPADVTVYAGGRIKHMTRGMNEVLGQSFGDVRASLGRFKARALVARSPLPSARTLEPTFPRRAQVGEIALEVVAHGGVFAGTRLDIGTRYLLEFLDQMAPDAAQAIDVGCGTGILATSLARARPGLHVLASDQSAAATASTAATARANSMGGAVTVLRDDALSTCPDACADLVVCNPPFHSGTALHTDAAHRMFAAAARVLRPGGELWTVYNSHLLYKRDLGRVVGPTTMMGQNPKFTVTRTVRRG
ncbi:16S rRNA m(2)G 1207 methyltransferase /23S rRNA m(2)G-1835 methyltransferase [Sanguibacter gelidistatuariae]|uniref:16S rRNA m(2)G 1207 methyltransferase /23S rRNA m(2)G-1835 methyltransferase n=1 Tax=Sanguibacter gelidistatuariae TaxID=1814289 RepID=A0A1G6H7D2_9MICO|nr:methyltransferase [Sanguibacter gelidistatuariae]SDB90054.1 16S rRNA m(2)G 1207 methyltransferase /23S rRNA m(2)G-1835 methyltransferase [Sanguibacter gelidistatuariae]